MMSGTGSGMNTRYYEIRDVSKTVLQEDLKKAYFIASNLWLSDPEKSKEVAEAYEVLSDPEKREIYDQNGEDALRMGGGGGRLDPEDLYRLTFGAFNPFGVGGLLCCRRKNVIHPLKVSLEELYSGTSKKLSIFINVMSSKCKGTGSKSGTSMKCSGCKGSGETASTPCTSMKCSGCKGSGGTASTPCTSMNYSGCKGSGGTASTPCTSMNCSGCKGSGGTASTPFLRALLSYESNAWQICKQCNGTGETISDHCTLCNGEKVVQENQGYCVVVERGMTNGQEIVFPRERGVKDSDKFIGDRVTFLLQEEEHPLLQREGDDLILKHTLSLKEALWGFELVLTHLDNRKLIIRANPSEVIKPGQVKVIKEEGMPVYQRPCMKGKLCIHFSVDFSLPLELYKDLESALPLRTSVLTNMELANCEKPTLHNVSIEGMRKQARQPNEEGDEEVCERMSGMSEKKSVGDLLLLKSGILPLKVSLEDLYSGTTKKIGLSMKVKCSKCKGKGSDTISNDNRCPWCLGEKFVREKHVLQVAVEKGMQDGQKIMLPEEDRVVWDRSTGDTFSFLLRQKEHPTFKREGDDLFVEHTLSIIEALWGFEFILTHLDNRKLLIKSNPREVVKPDQLKAINDEGMPMYGQPSMRGNLYIHFSVDFSLSPALYKAFETVMPPRTSFQPTEMEEPAGNYAITACKVPLLE